MSARPLLAVDLKFGPDGPYMLRSEGRLRPDQFAFIPGVRVTGREGGACSCRSWSPPELLRRTTMDPERETKFRSAFGELRPWVDASLTVAKALLTQSRHYYCLGRGPTKGGELPVSLPSAGVLPAQKGDSKSGDRQIAWRPDDQDSCARRRTGQSGPLRPSSRPASR